MSTKTISKLIGLYWYCYDYHNGQNSWQYRVLAMSSLRPRFSNLQVTKLGADIELAKHYYDKLVTKFES